MGNTHNDSPKEQPSVSTRRSISQPFRLEDWLLRQKKTCYDIYKHRRLNQQIQIYTVDVAFNDDLSIYELRKCSQFGQLPRLLHYELINNNNKMICHHNNKYVRVVLQRIPIRLSELKEITFRPVQTLLYETLEGYQMIHLRYGPVRVTPDMIGFTAEGMTKVWLNSNFARNQPNAGDKLQATAENYLVENIFSLYDQFLKGVVNDRKKYMTFNEAFQYLKDRINRMHTLPISIPEKYNQILGYEQTQPILHQNQPVRNIQSKQHVRPINYILVKNPPKIMHMDSAEQRNNISATSQPSQKIGASSNAQLRMTDINCMSKISKLEPQIVSALTQSRGAIRHLTNPRNAINQLSGLGGGHPHTIGFQVSEVQNNSNCSPNPAITVHEIPTRMKVSTSGGPNIIRHVAGNVINTNSNASPPRIIKIAASNISSGLNHINISGEAWRKTMHSGHTQPQQLVSNSMTVQPKYFPKQQTTNFSFESIQDKGLKDLVEKRIVQPAPVHLDNKIPSVQVNNNLTHSINIDPNTSNNSSSSYRQPIITFAVGKSMSSITIPPQNQSQPQVQSVNQQVLLNRNINFRPKMGQTRCQNTGTTNQTYQAQDNRYTETLASKPSVKAINIDDREYKALQFLKEKRVPVTSVTNTLNNQHSVGADIYRPINIAVNSNVPTIINKDNNESKVFFNYTTVPNVIQVIPSPTTIVQPMGERFQVISRNDPDTQIRQPFKHKNTQQHEVQTFIESKTVAVQMDENRSSASTNQLQQEVVDQNELQLLQQQSHKKMQLRTTGSKNKSKTYTQRQDQISQKNPARTLFEHSTESKIISSHKKSIIDGNNAANVKSKIAQRVAVTQPKQKRYGHVNTFHSNEHQTQLVNLNDQNTKSIIDHNKNKIPEVKTDIKIVYSYLYEQPLKLNTASTINSYPLNIHIEPLPLQKMTEPRLISQSDHSFPQPQPQQLEFKHETSHENPLEEQNLYNRSIEVNSEDQIAMQQQNYEQTQGQENQGIFYLKDNNQIIKNEDQRDMYEEQSQRQQYNNIPSQFYHQVCEYHEQAGQHEEQEDVSLKQLKPQHIVQYHPSHQMHPPSNQMNIIPPKLSSTTLKDEVAAVLYDDFDYQHIQDGRNISDTYYHHNTFTHPSITTQKQTPITSIEKVIPFRVDRNPNLHKSFNNRMTTPVGLGFSINKRETTSRIKQILAEEKIKREDKQHFKTSYERLMSDKRNTFHNNPTMYLSTKLERQKLQEQEQRRQQQMMHQRAKQQINYKNKNAHQEQYYEEDKNQQLSQAEEEQGFYAQLKPMQFIKEESVHSNNNNQNNLFMNPQQILMDQHKSSDNYVQELEKFITQQNNPSNQIPSIQTLNNFESNGNHHEQIRLAKAPNQTHNNMTKQNKFGRHTNPNANGTMEPLVLFPGKHQANKKPISYDDLRADLKNLLRKSMHRPAQQHEASRRSSKQKTIEQKIRQKKSNFANLKEQAARVLGL